MISKKFSNINKKWLTTSLPKAIMNLLASINRVSTNAFYFKRLN